MKKPNLQVRLDPASHQRLTQIVDALHKAGRRVSMTRFVSDLILSQPVPSNNEQKPTDSQQENK
jgi:hypothetical protein